MAAVCLAASSFAALFATEADCAVLSVVVSSELGSVVGACVGAGVEGAVVAGPGSSGAPTTGTAQPESQQAPRREREEQEAFDVGAASQEAILKRAKPLLIGAGVLLVLIWLLRRRR